jgi:hypothetical protein
MERKLYIWAAALLGLAGVVLAVHVWGKENSLPAMVTVYGRTSGHSVSREVYVRTILLDAFLLPAICGLFAFVAHAGREIDIISWFFVAGFYLALWWLRLEVDHLSQIGGPQTKGITVDSTVSPLGLLAFAVGTGLAFWKWKQDWGGR